MVGENVAVKNIYFKWLSVGLGKVGIPLYYNYGSEGRGFEFLEAHHKNKDLALFRARSFVVLGGIVLKSVLIGKRCAFSLKRTTASR